jgi:hypothetical protein
MLLPIFEEFKMIKALPTSEANEYVNLGLGRRSR